LSRSLLESVRDLIARTYRIRCGLDEIGPFVIGDRGLRRLYAGADGGHVVSSARGEGAKTLVRETGDGVAACIYFPDAMIRQLESFPPQRGVGHENVDAFSTFVEEIDHLLVIAERTRGARPVSRFELELHANVSKYLVVARFLAGSAPRLAESRRVWLRRRLFDGVDYDEPDPQARTRYRDAARWAARLLDRLPGHDPAATVALLRRFHAAPIAGKLRLIDRLGRRGAEPGA
jgi:hypothetical protein